MVRIHLLISETNVLKGHLYDMHFLKRTSKFHKKILIILVIPYPNGMNIDLPVEKQR